jgi:hypothetical protein
MDPMAENCIIEHRLRVARAERLGPHFFELELQKRQHGREPVARALQRLLGAALVAVGARLQGVPPADRSATAVPSSSLGR